MHSSSSRVVADAAWLESEIWSHGATALPLAASPLTEQDAEHVVEMGAELIGVAPDGPWTIGAAPNERFVIGLAGNDLEELTPTAMLRIATGLDVLVARDEAAATARLNAMLLERARIASDVHQGVCQEIATLILQLQVLEEVIEDGARARALLVETRRSAELCSENLRAALVHLAPDVPPGVESLTADLQRSVADFASTWGLDLSFDVLGRATPVDPDVVALIFAFVQEGLTNLRKHSSSDKGLVRVAFDNGAVRVHVVDDKSFATRRRGKDMPLPAGHGLSLMRSRAKLLGGDVRCLRVDERHMMLGLEIPA